MKKLLIILSLLLMLSMTLVSAQIEPTVTNITTISTFEAESSCFSAGTENNVYCLDRSPKTISLYNITDDTFTPKYNFTYGGTPSTADTLCVYYPTDDNIYCFMDGGGGEQHFKIDLDFTTRVNLSVTSGNTYTSGSSCDLRPTTDEIYCWGGGSTPNYLQLYNITADSWTIIKDMGYEGADTTRTGDGSCSFRNSSEFWCAGGGPIVSSSQVSTDKGLYHNVITNVTTNITMASRMFGGHCTWSGDVFYCFGHEDSGNPKENIVFYNPANSTTGNLTTELPVGLVTYGSCGDSSDNISYCITGYAGVGWEESKDVFKIQWGFSCVENWTASFTSCTVGDNQTLIYTDDNACGTFGDLPVDNGTVSSCNFCTPTFVESSLECVTGDSERDITYDYTNSCCTDTGLPTDCTITANTTESCIGIHESSDVPAIVVDLGVELGVQYIAFAGLIALFGVGLWAVAQWRKK